MLEQLLPYERSAFFFLNGSDSTFLDYFMWLYSYKLTWLPLYIFFLALFIYKYRHNWREWLLILASISLLILICDQVASGILKPLFERPRPTHHPDFKDQVDTVLGYRGGRFGFASSHASNVFGFATFCALLFRNRIFTLLIFTHALITSYSRIYLGVHFISDILAGMLIGVISGILVYRLYLYIRKKIIIKNRRHPTIPHYTSNETYWICGGYFLSLMFILIFSNSLTRIIE